MCVTCLHVNENTNQQAREGLVVGCQTILSHILYVLMLLNLVVYFDMGYACM